MIALSVAASIPLLASIVSVAVVPLTLTEAASPLPAVVVLVPSASAICVPSTISCSLASLTFDTVSTSCVKLCPASIVLTAALVNRELLHPFSA